MHQTCARNQPTQTFPAAGLFLAMWIRSGMGRYDARNNYIRTTRGSVFFICEVQSQPYPHPLVVYQVRLSLWVSFCWLTFGKWSNGLIPRYITSTKNGVFDRPWFFWVVGSNPTFTIMNFFRLSPCQNLKNTLPGIPRKWNGLNNWQVRPYILPTCHPAVSGGKSVIRLSLGKLLVNLLQVVKRTKN